MLDALQWADPSSIDVLVELMDVTDEAPILFAYVFTPEPDAPSWQLKEQAARAFPHRYAEIGLGPLPERAAHELMCSLLSCAETPAQVEALVLARADGNPFFIEEVLRALIENGALRYDGERWVADTDISEIEIPNTLLATVMARIDRLPAGVRRTLQVAAIVGRVVPEKVLRRVTDSGPELDRHLREALRAGLLREEAVIPERRYAFSQALIHEAAARSLLVRRRKEIHVQVGWALEEIYADNLEARYGELARHFWEGESWERAFRYSRLAAEQAAAAFANDEAVAAFTMALESAERSAAGAAPKVVALLAERRGDVRAQIGEYDAALADYRAAIEHHLDALKDATDPAEEQAADPEAARIERATVGALALKMARLYSYQGQVEMTRSKLEMAFNHLPPDSPDLSSAWSLKAAMYTWATDMEKAAEAGRKALEIARERGTFQHLGEAYEALTHPSMIGVLGLEIAELGDEWVRLARERPEDRQSLFKALTAHGLVHVWVFWTFDEALRADALEALKIAQDTGSTAAENTARGILGAGQLLVGEWDGAEAELRRSAGQATTLLGVGCDLRVVADAALDAARRATRGGRPDGDLAPGRPQHPSGGADAGAARVQPAAGRRRRGGAQGDRGRRHDRLDARVHAVRADAGLVRGRGAGGAWGRRGGGPAQRAGAGDGRAVRPAGVGAGSGPGGRDPGPHGGAHGRGAGDPGAGQAAGGGAGAAVRAGADALPAG